MCLCGRNWETSWDYGWDLWGWWKGRETATARRPAGNAPPLPPPCFILALSVPGFVTGRGRGGSIISSYNLVDTHTPTHTHYPPSRTHARTSTRAYTHTRERKSVCFEWNNAAQLANVCKGLFKLWYSWPPRYWNFFEKSPKCPLVKWKWEKGNFPIHFLALALLNNWAKLSCWTIDRSKCINTFI